MSLRAAGRGLLGRFLPAPSQRHLVLGQPSLRDDWPAPFQNQEGEGEEGGPFGPSLGESTVGRS